MVIFLFLIILVGLGLGGWAFYMNKKTETFSVPELFQINGKPTMPAGTNTSFFLKKSREFTDRKYEKVSDFTCDEFPFANYHIGFFSEEKNSYIILSQFIPNQLQKYLGLTDKPFVSIYTVFNDGSDIETTNRTGADKEIKSDYRKINYLDELPIELMLNKHREKVDIVETKGIREISLKKENMLKHIERGLKIDVAFKTTHGYVTKVDLEDIVKRLGIKLQEEKQEGENREDN